MSRNRAETNNTELSNNPLDEINQMQLELDLTNINDTNSEVISNIHVNTNNETYKENSININTTESPLSLTYARAITMSPKLIKSPVYRRNSLGEIFIPVTTVEDDFYGETIEHKLLMQLTNKRILFYHKYPYIEHKKCYFDTYHEDPNGCLCFTLSYNHIREMGFYNSQTGMFNNNPNDYFVPSITRFIPTMRANKEVYSRKCKSFVKSTNDGVSLSTFMKKVFNRFTSSEKIKKHCSTPYRSILSLNEDSLYWLDNDLNGCFISIDYHDSLVPHLDSKKFYLKTTKLNGNKINYFICNGVLTMAYNNTTRPTLNVIESLDFADFKYINRILHRDLLKKLRYFFKPTAICGPIFLAYSTLTHGSSLNTLYNKCEEYHNNPCILLIKDYKGNIFGATLSNSPNLYQNHYFGDGSCCVFKYSSINKNLDIFRWSYDHSYFILCDKHYMAIGGSTDIQNYGYAIWLDNDLYTGTSDKSTTFKNPILSTSQLFHIVTLEVWVLGDKDHPHQ